MILKSFAFHRIELLTSTPRFLFGVYIFHSRLHSENIEIFIFFYSFSLKVKLGRDDRANQAVFHTRLASFFTLQYNIILIGNCWWYHNDELLSIEIST
jgi:hypothetical protein